MELQEKLRILADSAKYDASCSSSGSIEKIAMVLVIQQHLVYVTLSLVMVDAFRF